MRAPTTNRVTQGKHGNFSAIDYSYLPDPNIYAPESGKVTSYGPAGTCGNNLQITSGGNVHGFCHLERATVAVGQTVNKGQVVGVMGYTGYTIPAGPSGRHLHWVVRQNGVYTYPPSLVNESSTVQRSTTMSPEYVKNQYRFVAGREPSAAEVDFHVKNSTPDSLFNGFANNNELAVPKLQKQTADLSKAVTTLTAQVTSLQQTVQPLKNQVAELTKALADEKAKPPKEVIVEKPVEVIVEKPVDEQATVTNWFKRIWNNLFNK